MDAHTLTAWTRFALQKGGIGSCTALIDNPATEPEDLMFMTGEKIIVLRRLDEEGTDSERRASTTDSNSWFLGYCEGVVGRFKGAHVQFHGKLKKPVLMRRSGASSSSHGHIPSLGPGRDSTGFSNTSASSPQGLPTSPLRSSTLDERAPPPPINGAMAAATPNRRPQIPPSPFRPEPTPDNSNASATIMAFSSPAGQQGVVTAPLALRRPFRAPAEGAAAAALQAQQLGRVDLTTPPLSDDAHQSNNINNNTNNNRPGLTMPPRAPPIRSNTANVIAEKSRAPPPADVQAAGESFRRRVADALQVDDDDDSDDSTSMLPWARGTPAHDDDDSDDDNFGLSSSAPGSVRRGVRTPEHATANSTRIPDLPTAAAAASKGFNTPVKDNLMMATDPQRTLAKLATSGLPPSPISSADSPSARNTAPIDVLTPTQTRAPRRPAAGSESGVFTIAAQSSAPSSRSSGAAETTDEDEEPDRFDDDEQRSEGSGSMVSAESGSAQGLMKSNGAVGSTRLNAPNSNSNNNKTARRSRGGARGGGGGKNGRDYAFSIYDLYGRDSVAFPNFEMHKEANKAMYAKTGLADLDKEEEEGGGGTGREPRSAALTVQRFDSFSAGRASPGGESTRSTGTDNVLSVNGGRPSVRTPVGNRPMNPPPINTVAPAITSQQSQEQAARSLHLRSLSQKRPMAPPDPRKSPVPGQAGGAAGGAGGPPGMPTKSLASSLRRQVEGSGAGNNSGPGTAVSSPTLSHTGPFSPTAGGGGGGANPNGFGAVPPTPSISFDPNRRPSAPAAVVNGAAVGMNGFAGSSSSSSGGGGPGAGPRPPMPGQAMQLSASFSGPSSGPRPGMSPGLGQPPLPLTGLPNGPGGMAPLVIPTDLSQPGMAPAMPPQSPIDGQQQIPGPLAAPGQTLVIRNPGPPGPMAPMQPGLGGLGSPVLGAASVPVPPQQQQQQAMGPGGMMQQQQQQQQPPLTGPGGPPGGLAPGAIPINGSRMVLPGGPGMGFSPQGPMGTSPNGSMMSGGISPTGPSIGPTGPGLNGFGPSGPHAGPGGPFPPPAMGPPSPGFGPMVGMNGGMPSPGLNNMMQLAGTSPGARGSGGPVRASSDRTPDRESGRGSALLKKNPSNPNPSGSLRGSGLGSGVGSSGPAAAAGPASNWNGPPIPGGMMPPAFPAGGPGHSSLAPSMRGDPSRSPSPFSGGGPAGGGPRGGPSPRPGGPAPSMRSFRGGGEGKLPGEASSPVVYDASGFVMGTQPNALGISPVPEDGEVIDKWDAILREGDLITAKKSRKVKKMCQSGIPSSMRAPVWLFLSNSAIRRRPGLFEQLCKQSQEKKARKGKETVYEQIEKDVERCYPDHRLFRGPDSAGRKDLEAILKAYAQYNPVVGYTQGIGLIVGLFLMFMPAEDAFWLLCALLRDVHMEGYYTDNMKQLHVDGVVFGQLLQSMDPEVHARLTSWGIEPINYVPNWFLPMFSRILPWQTVLRIWDTFFFEGPIWIVRLSLAIIRIIREPLMACKDYDSALTLLFHPPPNNLSPDNVLGCALSVKLKDGEVRKLSRTASKLVRQSNALNERGRSASRATDRNSTSARSLSMPAKR